MLHRRNRCYTGPKELVLRWKRVTYGLHRQNYMKTNTVIWRLHGYFGLEALKVHGYFALEAWRLETRVG
jgi:hypothetical protein